MVPLLNEHQISVIARGPLAKGILTDNNARKIERVKEKDYLSYSYDELHATLASVKRNDWRTLFNRNSYSILLT